MGVGRIERGAVVQEALAGDVVVEPEHHRPGHAFLQGGQRGTRHAGVQQAGVEGVGFIHLPQHQVEAEPAALVLIISLVLQPPGGKAAAEVFGLHQPGMRDLAANGLHGALDGTALQREHAQEAGLARLVRRPVAIEAGEARGGQRLVHRGPVGHPGVAPRGTAGEGGKLLGQGVIQQASIAGAAAVMDQPGNGGDAEAPEFAQPLVMPRPVAVLRLVRGDALPADRVAQPGEAKPGHGVEIGDAVVMPGFAELVAQGAADQDNTAFQPPPNLGGGALSGWGHAVLASCGRRSAWCSRRAKSVVPAGLRHVMGNRASGSYSQPRTRNQTIGSTAESTIVIRAIG